MLYLLTLIAPHSLVFFLIVYKESRLTPIHLPPKIGVSHLHIFEEGVFCRKMIKQLLSTVCI
ncbi:hypothetical protein COK09_17270 [Bacillus cereus]|nr:hypothetical protein CON44_26380 [Bacillus cereus]PER25782.1 hypothetical protein CN485_21320 [Bacillus cereus]PEY95992.1 hypothetical protein CN349_23920 [Bacillus cereus]PFP57432.1 hypothetical protein COK09_17270 [Bacillus cereus]PGP67046.1 hypothetical protein CN998_19640 [Bacillus cereus]